MNERGKEGRSRMDILGIEREEKEKIVNSVWVVIKRAYWSMVRGMIDFVSFAL